MNFQYLDQKKTSWHIGAIILTHTVPNCLLSVGCHKLEGGQSKQKVQLWPEIPVISQSVSQ